MATEIQRLTFTNAQDLQGRYINLYNSSLGAFTATLGWNYGDLLGTFEHMIGGYLGYVENYSVVSDNGNTVVFEIEFIESLGNVGTTSINTPLDPLYGLGADLRCTLIYSGGPDDEYGMGGTQERWQLGYYNNVVPVSGTWKLSLENGGTYQTDVIPYDVLEYSSVNGYTAPLNWIPLASGNLNNSPPLYLEYSAEVSHSQPAVSYINIDSVISTFSAEVIREGSIPSGGNSLFWGMV